MYINVTFDGNNEPENPAASLLDLLSQGNAQNLKVYLHFLLTTENCIMFVQPALATIIYYGFIISQSVTDPEGLTLFITSSLNSKIHHQDSR